MRVLSSRPSPPPQLPCALCATPAPLAVAVVGLVAAVLLGAIGFVAPAALGAQESPAPEPGVTELAPLPDPDLSGLEPVVVERLQEARASALWASLDEDVPAAARASAFGRLGRFYHAHELLDAAAVCYRNALALEPGSSIWLHSLGLALEGAGDLEAASDAYGRALAVLDERGGDEPTTIDPSRHALRLHLARVRLEQGRSDDARALLEQARRVRPDDPALLALQGETALALRDWDRAVEFLEAALERFPAATRLHYLLGLAHRGRGDLEAARFHLEQRGEIGVAVDDPVEQAVREIAAGGRVHLLRGRRAYSAGDYGSAVDEFRQALEEEPSSVAARLNLAAALAELGDSVGAMEQLERLLLSDPDNPTVRFNLGVLLLRAARPAEAVPQLEQAIQLAPDDGQSHHQLARGLVALGRAEEALPHFERAIEAMPETEAPRIDLANALVTLGRWSDLKATLEAAHAALPLEGRVAHSLARVLAACPEAGLREGERALDLALRVYDAVPTAEHAETVALALGELGRCEEAAAVAARALAEHPMRTARQESLEATLERARSGPPCRPPAADPPAASPASEPPGA